MSTIKNKQGVKSYCVDQAVKFITSKPTEIGHNSDVTEDPVELAKSFYAFISSDDEDADKAASQQ